MSICNDPLSVHISPPSTTNCISSWSWYAGMMSRDEKNTGYSGGMEGSIHDVDENFSC